MSALTKWCGIPAKIEKEVRGVRDFDRSGGEEGLTIRENVHHIVESNLIASNMIITALATNGGYYDWTWIWPDKSWMSRMGYDKADVKPALAMLHALADHVRNLIATSPDALKRKVELSDAPDAPRYSITIEKIFEREVEHAGEHLEQIRAIRKSSGRVARPRARS